MAKTPKPVFNVKAGGKHGECLAGPALCCVPAITRSDALTQSSCHPYKGIQTLSLLLSFTLFFLFYFFLFPLPLCYALVF